MGEGVGVAELLGVGTLVDVVDVVGRPVGLIFIGFLVAGRAVVIVGVLVVGNSMVGGAMGLLEALFVDELDPAATHPGCAATTSAAVASAKQKALPLPQ